MFRHLLTLLVCMSYAHASTVTVDACGADEDRAVERATQKAVQKVTGTFLSTETRTRNGTYDETIVEYGGGLVTKLSVLDRTTKNGLVCVLVSADVNTDKINNRHESEFQLPSKESITGPKVAYTDAVETSKFFDDPLKAYTTINNKSSFFVEGPNTVVKITGTLIYQPKWVSDVETFVRQSGVVLDVDDEYIHNLGHLTIPLMVVGVPPAAALKVLDAVSFAQKLHAWRLRQPSYSNRERMVCFAKTADKDVDTCVITHARFPVLGYKHTARMELQLSRDGQVVWKMKTGIVVKAVMARSYAGGSKMWIESRNVYRPFPVDTDVIVRHSGIDFDQTFTIPTNVIERTDSMKLVVVE